MDDSIVMKRFEIVIGAEYVDQLTELLEDPNEAVPQNWIGC
ncbi:hypothetical protein [Nitrosomonas sp.]|nr:hypothetical protein [Nitrosomonas sp.]